MTAAISPARRGRPGRPCGPALAWNTLRQHRLTLIVLASGFALSAIWLAVNGLQTHAAYGQYLRDGCLTGGDMCRRLIAELRNGSWLTGVLPWLVGVFIGAPLVAREFETDSYRFSAVQSTTFRRQVIVKLLLFGFVIVIGGSLLGLLGTWSVNPWHRIAVGYNTGMSYWFPDYFSVTAVMLPALALLDFCLGTAFGALFKRVIPAMAATTGAVLVVAALTTGWSVTGSGSYTFGPVVKAVLRTGLAARPGGVPVLSPVRGSAVPHSYQQEGLMPVVPVGPGQTAEANQYPDYWAGPAGSLEVTAWFTGPGARRLSLVAAQLMLDRIPPPVATHPARLRPWLASRGVSYRIGYQPASRYWQLQALVAALLTALALAAASGTVLLGQRRR